MLGKKLANRCGSCNKRVGLMRFKCHCENATRFGVNPSLVTCSSIVQVSILSEGYLNKVNKKSDP
ncbi:hypothetical protein IEQ34_015486 [Dendrobium chrysotoxum]|uniref:Uncharacterized protein n=1 Tax=Dendrobium chrysotoxum TaxID=161865 RepID=A0AAV7GHW4_DENCH|nr:hypothetical protein IEQ34_015486 [Dendrobium chrysotoxum]